MKERETGGGSGLRGTDKQQDALRDTRSGTYGGKGIERKRTRSAAAQDNPSKVTVLPEGLQRSRKPPYDKDLGRAEEPE